MVSCQDESIAGRRSQVTGPTSRYPPCRAALASALVARAIRQHRARRAAVCAQLGLSPASSLLSRTDTEAG